MSQRASALPGGAVSTKRPGTCRKHYQRRHVGYPGLSTSLSSMNAVEPQAPCTIALITLP